MVELELILTALRLLHFVILAAFCCTVGYEGCVINFSNSFQLMFLKLCRRIKDMMKICMSGFDGDRINFDRIMAF